MNKTFCALLCVTLAVTTLQPSQARPARALLQTASSSSEADAASWVQANLTGPSPNVQAASSAVAQAASSATSSGSASSSALATAFVNVLLNAGDVSANATASAYSQALTQTKGDDNSQQVIAQAYSSAILSLYQADQVEAASTAIAVALLVGQDSSVVAANAAAFATSNATAIAAATASANDTARPGIDCLDYSKGYADAVTSVVTANPIQVSAAASAVAAAFAQGCAVEEATGLALTEAIYNIGCETVGPVLLSAQAYAADTANGFAGNSTAFASATARFSIVRECLYNATTASSAEASASATAASTAIAQSNATSASQAITGAICNPVTATATAQAFAQAIATAQGCNGVIYEAISSAYASASSTVTSCGTASASAYASASASASLFFDYPSIASCRAQVAPVKPVPLNPSSVVPTPTQTPKATPAPTPSPTITPNIPIVPGVAPAMAPAPAAAAAGAPGPAMAPAPGMPAPEAGPFAMVPQSAAALTATSG